MRRSEPDAILASLAVDRNTKSTALRSVLIRTGWRPSEVGGVYVYDWKNEGSSPNEKKHDRDPLIVRIRNCGVGEWVGGVKAHKRSLKNSKFL